MEDNLRLDGNAAAGTLGGLRTGAMQYLVYGFPRRPLSGNLVNKTYSISASSVVKCFSGL
jgi:hypothetical protein